MTEQKQLAALRMQRQFLTAKADTAEYDRLYRDTQPGQNVYWHGFGDPPSITYRADFDDIAYNKIRQQERKLLKGRFQGGNLGWIVREDLELFIGLSRKPLKALNEKQEKLLTLIQREGPLNIQQIKEFTGMLVKEITPVLHRLQEAFLVYEDQPEGEWDRGWYHFPEMFADIDPDRYTRHEALCELLPRFCYRHVAFDSKMAKSFYKLPEKDIKAAVQALVEQAVLVEQNGIYLLKEDLEYLKANQPEPPKSVIVLHRNDFLVKSNEEILKQKFRQDKHETLQYLFIDGEFHGAVVGKFKYGPYILEDVVLDLPAGEAAARKEEIIAKIYEVNGRELPLKLYNGEAL